jgi:hypothetical protein
MTEGFNLNVAVLLLAMSAQEIPATPRFAVPTAATIGLFVMSSLVTEPLQERGWQRHH